MRMKARDLNRSGLEIPFGPVKRIENCLIELNTCTAAQGKHVAHNVQQAMQQINKWSRSNDDGHDHDDNDKHWGT